MELETQLLEILHNSKGLNGTRGINTYELCRTVNGIKNRRFCHAKRREQPKKNQPLSNYRGALDPTGDCSNDTQNCCRTSFRSIIKALRRLEKQDKVKSKRAKSLDIKRFRTFAQISRDIYRFWFAVEEV